MADKKKALKPILIALLAIASFIAGLVGGKAGQQISAGTDVAAEIIKAIPEGKSEAGPETAAEKKDTDTDVEKK